MKNFSAIKEIISSLEEGIENGTLKSTKELTIRQYLSAAIAFIMVFLAMPSIEALELGIFPASIIIIGGAFSAYCYFCIISSVQYKRTTRFIKETISNNDLKESDFDFIFLEQTNKKELREHLRKCKNKLIAEYNIA